MKRSLVIVLLILLMQGVIFCKEKKEKKERKRDINLRIEQISNSTGLSKSYILNLYREGYWLSTILLLGNIYKATRIEPLIVLKLKEKDEKFKEISPYFGIQNLGEYKTIGEYLKSEKYQPKQGKEKEIKKE